MAASLGFGGSKVSKDSPIQSAFNPENNSVWTYPRKLPELQPGEQLTCSLSQAADKTNATGNPSTAQPAFQGPAHMVKSRPRPIAFHPSARS